MIRCRLVLGLSFFVFCVVPMLLCEARYVARGSIAADTTLRSSASLRSTSGNSQRLVSREMLKQAELEILWEAQLPIKKGESLERLFIPFDLASASAKATADKSAPPVAGRGGNRIYGLTSENFMVSMNRETGNVIFKRTIAKTGLPVVGLELYKDGLFSIVGNKLVEINPESGTERPKAKRLGFGVSCPAARNSSYFYVGGTDRRMHVLRTEDKVQVFEVAAERDSEIASIVADENSVVFATGAGEVISISPDKPRRLWQFKAKADGGIAQPIVKDAESVFAASRDTNIYRLDAKKGKLIWKYQIGAMLEKGPRVTESVVYQYARNEGLLAIDKEGGTLLWQLPEGVDLLAEADGKSYVITKTGTLAVMDNKKAKQIYTVDLSGVSVYAANVADSKIYIADKEGRIACLQPIKY
jgi:outer membrane protein assembly factor BamB